MTTIMEARGTKEGVFDEEGFIVAASKQTKAGQYGREIWIDKEATAYEHNNEEKHT